MATITISFDITDEMQVILLNNFNEMTERQIAAKIDGYELSYNIEPKTESENNLQFGKRCIQTIVLKTVKANALRTDRYRYNEEHDSLIPIHEDVPEDLLI